MSSNEDIVELSIRKEKKRARKRELKPHIGREGKTEDSTDST